jgi:two-component system cell cycle sensor histidine kinase/response regulator CckA
MTNPQPKVILVVDDEEPVRMMERRILEQAGYQVIEAADGAAALAILQGDTRLELVVSDVDMPNLAGDDLARQVRAVRPGLKVLFVTGHVPKLFKGQQLLEDDRSFLSKPFSAKGLLEAVSLLRYGTLNPPPFG